MNILSRIAQCLIAVCLICIVCLAAPFSCNAIEPSYIEDFEDHYYQTTNWKESDTYWYARASISSEVPLDDFDWDINITNDYQTPNGEWCVELAIDGQHGQGVVWLEKKFQYFNPPTSSISLQGILASNWEDSTNKSDILIYIGTEKPNDETDLRRADNKGLATWWEYQNEWRMFFNEFAMRVTRNTTLYLALGVSITSKGNQTYYIDRLMWTTFGEPELWKIVGIFISSVLPVILLPLFIIVIILIIFVSLLLKRRTKKNRKSM
ncbi:MAG: hypothetical protein ACFFC7_15650 [Candidatus Hermodarchaeota archaeon]